jgi:hypothetical protein
MHAAYAWRGMLQMRQEFHKESSVIKTSFVFTFFISETQSRSGESFMVDHVRNVFEGAPS